MKGKSATKAPLKAASRAATAEEISQAIEALTLQDSVRLSAYSRNRIAAIGPHAANGRTATTSSRRPLSACLMGAGTGFPKTWTS